MHTLDGRKGNRFPAGELLRPDLACLGSTLVAVTLVKFNPPLGVVAYPFPIVSIGFESLSLVVSVDVAANRKPLLGVGKLCIRCGIGHATAKELVAGFIRLGCW